MARPMADSAAATVKIKNTNTWPVRSLRKCENAMKFKLTDSNINSMHINNMMMFLRLIKMPATLMQNNIAASINTSDKINIFVVLRYTSAIA